MHPGMTYRKALPVAILADDPCADNVVLWTHAARRAAAARLAHGGDGAGSQPPDEPRGRVVLWPHRYVPPHLADSDAAIRQIWRLHEVGLLNWHEAGWRETELKAQRCARWLWLGVAP
jgi:hypothetical protein